MKFLPHLLLALLPLWPAAPALAQQLPNATTAGKLPTMQLYVSDQKTTHLVFPAPIAYVDLGSKGIIAAKATGSENIVRVKAAGPGFAETNMTVLTGGKLYTFVVDYQRSPRVLGVDLSAVTGTSVETGKLPLQPLYVSDQKTTHLIFPYPVTYVDLGNTGLIASKAAGAENIVRVKAAGAGFPETNMTVLTSGGRLYMFQVAYQHDPKVLSLDLGTGDAVGGKNEAILSNSPIAQGNMDAYSKIALKKGGSAANDTQNQLSLRAGKVGYRQETLFFPLHLANKSNVTYDIDFVKFYIQDKQVAKRTAEQAIELQPIYVYNGSDKKIGANSKVEQVYIFKKFTIPDQKQLIVELYEKGGGRNIRLKLSNSDLLGAYTFK